MRVKKLILQIIGNTLVQAVGKIISAILSFLSIALLTRYLGISGYGNYTLVFSYLAFFTLIADFGLQAIAVKELAGFGEKAAIYGTYFILRFFLVIFSSILAIFFLNLFPYSSQLKTGIIIGTIAVGISGMTGYFNTIFQSRIRFDLVTLLDILGRMISVCAILFFIFFKFNFYFIVGGVLIGNLVSFLTGVFLLPSTIRKTFDKKLAKKLFLLSVPVAVTSLLSTLYFKVDAIILSLYKTSAEVGIYSLAYKILENITLFWFFYVSTVYPLLAKFKKDNKQKYKSLLRNSLFLAIIVSVPTVIVAMYLSPFVITLFGGVQFAQSNMALRILLVSLPLLFINTIFYNFYIIEEFNVVVIVGMLLSLIFNVIFNVLFIPRFGYIAASYITVLSEIILFLTYLGGLKFIKRPL